MTKRVTAATLGAWLVKCNPETWDVERFLSDGHRVVHSWVVQYNYRSYMMADGDSVVLWVTGSSKAAGVRGVGRVTGKANHKPPAGHEEEETYWKQPSTSGLWVPVEIMLTEKVLPRQRVATHKALKDAEVFRAPQLGNPNFLDRAQWAAMEGVLQEAGVDKR